MMMMVIIIDIAVFEVFLLVYIQYEPIASLTFSRMRLAVISLLCVRHHLIQVFEYLKAHRMEISGMIRKVAFRQDELKWSFRTRSSLNHGTHREACLDGGVPWNHVSSAFLSLHEFSQTLLVRNCFL